MGKVAIKYRFNLFQKKLTYHFYYLEAIEEYTRCSISIPNQHSLPTNIVRIYRLNFIRCLRLLNLRIWKLFQKLKIKFRLTFKNSILSKKRKTKTMNNQLNRKE